MKSQGKNIDVIMIKYNKLLTFFNKLNMPQAKLQKIIHNLEFC